MAIRKNGAAKFCMNVELRIVFYVLRRNPIGTKLNSPCYENVILIAAHSDAAVKQTMSQTTSVVTISDELSSEVATAILTRQKELNRDPRELLYIVTTVHDTLRELSAKARERREMRTY